jgi:hypothetical protein
MADLLFKIIIMACVIVGTLMLAHSYREPD